eukprot:8467693-Alexandrium_andersonii.AAC.1
MQRQLDRVAEENRELRTVIAHVSEVTEQNRRRTIQAMADTERFGRHADVALASATWGSGQLRKDQNRQSAREAVVCDWPRR